MSKRAERREAERLARRAAYQKLRQPAPAAEPIATQNTDDLLARAQAFFDQPPTVSEAQVQANRANAQLSTGPVTAAGKATSSRNHTTHGLTAEPTIENFRVLPTENQAAYDRNLAHFRKEWKPETATEHDLVNRLVMHQWLRLRAQRLQERLFSPETGELTDTKKFELYRRYETSHERGFNKALADLQRLRAFQLRQQIGFESQKRKNEEHALKMQRLQAKNQPKSKPTSPTEAPIGTQATITTWSTDDIS